MLKSNYIKLVPQLMSELNLTSVSAVPKITKVVINVGVGSRALQDPKLIEQVVEGVAKITGQKPLVTKAKKSIAGFKVREGMPVGVSVTLRSTKMYDFLERLVHVSIPRIRDFQGLEVAGFDGRGNYNLGLREHIVFPEIIFDTTDKGFGLQITVVTTAKDTAGTKLLLQLLGFPFKKNNTN